MNIIAKKYVKYLDYINKVVENALAVILGVMSVLIFWQVVSRYLMGSPSSWSEELSRFLMVYLVMFGAATALKKGSLIAVDAVHEALSENVSKWIKVISELISIVFYVILVVYGWEFASNSSNQIAPGTGLSMFLIYLSMPLGGLFLTLNSIGVILNEFIKKKE